MAHKDILKAAEAQYNKMDEDAKQALLNSECSALTQQGHAAVRSYLVGRNWAEGNRQAAYCIGLNPQT